MHIVNRNKNPLKNAPTYWLHFTSFRDHLPYLFVTSIIYQQSTIFFLVIRWWCILFTKFLHYQYFSKVAPKNFRYVTLLTTAWKSCRWKAHCPLLVSNTVLAMSRLTRGHCFRQERSSSMPALSRLLWEISRWRRLHPVADPTKHFYIQFY